MGSLGRADACVSGGFRVVCGNIAEISKIMMDGDGEREHS